MVRLDCSNISFGAQLDEKYLFLWGSEIAGFVRWEHDTLVMRSKRVSAETLIDLLALFRRYGIPMQQLRQFENRWNTVWFRSPEAYWHHQVFGA